MYFWWRQVYLSYHFETRANNKTTNSFWKNWNHLDVNNNTKQKSFLQLLPSSLLNYKPSIHQLHKKHNNNFFTDKKVQKYSFWREMLTNTKWGELHGAQKETTVLISDYIFRFYSVLFGNFQKREPAAFLLNGNTSTHCKITSLKHKKCEY